MTARETYRMESVFILCEWDEHEHARFEMIGWYSDSSAAEAEALRREWADYEKAKANEGSYRTILSPDEREFRRYWVEELRKMP